MLTPESTALEWLYHWESTTPDRVYLRQALAGAWREYTWREVGQQARRMAAALRARGIVPGDRVSILSRNCAHWLLADFAIMLAGAINVPVYPNQHPDEIAYVLAHAGSNLLFAGRLEQAAAVEARLPPLPRIVFPYPGALGGDNWDDVVAGQPPLAESRRPDPEELCAIFYTSGTTGTPKGVPQEYGAMAFATANLQALLGFGAEDRFFSHLPLAHVAERIIVEAFSLRAGAAVSFPDSLETFQADLRAVRPTLFFSVPRLWMRFQQGVLAQRPAKRLDFILALPLLGALVARKIRRGLGLDAARWLLTGAAPTPLSLLHWYERLGLPILEGYGMSENSAYATFNHPGRRKLGTVGAPLPHCELRLSEDGEILTRHRAVMRGYYLDPERTAEQLQDGWLHTGDLGEIDAEGFVTITGRAKDTFKTSKGEWIVPSGLEEKLARNPLLEQICVVGAGLPQPIALVVLGAAAGKLARAEVENSVLETLATMNRELPSHARVGHCVLTSEPWTIEGGLLTPTLKLRRAAIAKRFEAQVQATAGAPPGCVWSKESKLS